MPIMHEKLVKKFVLAEVVLAEVVLAEVFLEKNDLFKLNYLYPPSY